MADFARKVARIADDVVAYLMFVWVAMIVAALVAIGLYAADRDPPFDMLSAPHVTVRAGEKLKFSADVRREVDRECEASFSRYLFSSQLRYDLGTSHASAAMIRMMELRHPGKLPVAIDVPPDFEAGGGVYVVVISYRCNRLHTWFPIVVTVDIPFTVVDSGNLPLADSVGIDPTRRFTSHQLGFQDRCLTYRPTVLIWCPRRDSNPQKPGF